MIIFRGHPPAGELSGPTIPVVTATVALMMVQARLLDYAERDPVGGDWRRVMSARSTVSSPGRAATNG